MSASPHTRRAVAEIDFSDSQAALFKIGDRSIHHFWHLFSAEFRHVLLAPQRRPDSGRVSWSWREEIEKAPVTATELAEVRRRLTEANRSLSGGFGGLDRSDDVPGGGATLEGQVRGNMREMVGQLIGQRDLALSGFVCRTGAGLMLHSWGAAVAAQPYYPDAAVGEISGTVFAGTQHLVGVTVLLENAHGTNPVRIQSDKEGGFRFPGVVAGSYHVRVADRSDFPGGGVAVTMERDSITGLELRSTSTESISMATNVSSADQYSAPWYKRRTVVFVAVLFLLAGAFFIWRAAQQPANQTQTKSQSSSWQSAHGQLSANGDKNKLLSDDRKVGPEGVFSTLSKTIPSPKPLTSHPASMTGNSKDFSSDKVPVQSDDLPTDRQPAGSDKKQKPEQEAKSGPRVEPSAKTKPSDSHASQSAASSETAQADKDSAGTDLNDDDSKSAETKLGKSVHGATDKKRPTTLAAASPAVAESASEVATAAAQETSTNPPASSVAAANGNGSLKAAGKNSTAPSQGAEPAGETNNPDADGTGSAPSGATAAASGGLKPSAAKKSKESAKGTGAAGTASSPAESATSAVAGNTPDDTTPTESALDKSSPKSARPQKASTGSAATPSESPTPSDPQNPEEAVASASSSPIAEAKKQSQVAASNRVNAAGPSSEIPATATESENESSNTATAPSADGAGSPRAPSKAPKKKPVAASSSVAEDKKQATEPGANSVAALFSQSVVAMAAENKSVLIPVGSVRVSAWKPRIIQDLIVPTRPVTAAEEEALETLRTKLLQERASQMSEEFQHPKMSNGFAIKFAQSGSGQAPPRWRNEAGLQPAGSSVHDQQAELDWGAVANTGGEFTLSYPDGRVIAQVKVGLNGASALRISPNARASYWFGIETAANRTARLDWRLLSGASIPATWSRDDRWLEGHGQRIDIPLDATSKRVGNYQIALTDPATGWALVGDVTWQ